MKHLIKFVAFALVFFSFEGCFTQKQLTDTLINIYGVDKVCFSSEPFNFSFDQNKPDAMQVQITLGNQNNYDVTASLSIEIVIRDKSNNVIGGTNTDFVTPSIFFPKNKTNVYTTPFIDIVSAIPLKVGEKYIIEARKYVIGASYSQSYNPFLSSCNLYTYPIILK